MAVKLSENKPAIRAFHALLCVVLVVLDQLTKYFARLNLSDGNDFIIIKGVFRLTFLKNTGAVWGIFSGHVNSAVVLTVVSIIILVFVLLMYFKTGYTKKYRLIRIIMVLIVAGAIGNLIDRIAFGYVTDFLYFELINFPVFNVADCYITLSCVAAVILMLTKYRDDEMEFLSFKKKEKSE